MNPPASPAGRSRSGSDVVRLDITNKDGHVVVVPSNEDRYVLRVSSVISACEAHQHDETVRRRFEVLLKRLGEWILQRDDVLSAWVNPVDGLLMFLVVRTAVAYDSEFEDQLTQLEWEIAHDTELSGFRFTTMSLPEVSDEGLNSFIDPKIALEFTPLRREPHDESGE